MEITFDAVNKTKVITHESGVRSVVTIETLKTRRDRMVLMQARLGQRIKDADVEIGALDGK